MRKIILFFIFTVLQFSCIKEEPFSFAEMPHVYFNLDRSILHNLHPGSSSKNILVDFSVKPSDITTDTIVLGVRVSGVASDIDREFDLQSIALHGNVQPGLDYTFLNQDFLIPGGGYDTTIHMIVHRTAALQNNELAFRLHIVANEHFQVGPQSDTSRAMNVTDLTITLRDILAQPSNWSTFIAAYFGGYSQVKYRFIIDTLRIASFSNTLSAVTMNNYKTQLVNALRTYNANRPEPLRDEHGELISF